MRTKTHEDPDSELFPDIRCQSCHTMSTSPQNIRLQTSFLQNAARLLAISSPSTASYLGSESVQLELANEPPKTAFPFHQRQHFCTACGSVFIPGQNCSIVRGDRIPLNNGSKAFRRRTVAYICQGCHQSTEFTISSPARLYSQNHQKNVSGSEESAHSTQQTASNQASANAKTSSKQRAKARKEKTGLQSLLKKSEQETRMSPQLSLMDFLIP